MPLTNGSLLHRSVVSRLRPQRLAPRAGRAERSTAPPPPAPPASRAEAPPLPRTSYAPAADRPAALRRVATAARHVLLADRIAYCVRIAIVAAAYYGTATFGLSLAHENSSITAVWAPTGIALAALVLGGYRLWPGVALGAFLANVATDAPLVAVAGITVGNTLEALVGVYLLRAARFRPSLERMRDVLALVVLAAVLSTAVSATIGVASLRVGDALESGLASAWRVWWLGDMGGDLLVAPLLLVCAAHVRARPRPRRLGEAAIFLAGLAVVSAGVFSIRAPLIYVLIPLLIWAALRFAQPGAAVASLLVAGIAVFLTDHGSGPFVRSSPDVSLLLAQSFVGVGAASALLFAAAASERRRAQEEVEWSRDELEVAVRERTAELARSNQELELQSVVAANMAEGVVLIRTSDATIVYANETFEQMFGYDPGELAGLPISVANPHVEGSAKEGAAIMAELEAHGGWSGEVESVKKDGTPFWCWANISTFVHRAHGTVWISVLTDITERKRVEEEHRRSALGLAQAQAIAHIGSWHWDIASDSVTWSNELYRIYGLEPGSVEVTYGRFLEQVHPEDRALVEESIGNAFRTGRPFSYDERIVRPDGSVRWLQSRGEVVMGADGPVSMHGTCQDVTDGRDAEVERARLAAIVEHSDDAIVATDFAGSILSWNASAERTYGYAAAEVIGKGIGLLMPPGLDDEVPEMLERVRAGEAIDPYETRRRRKDGTVIDVALTISPIRDPRGALVGASRIARDISERKQAEDALQKSQERFRNLIKAAPDGVLIVDESGAIVLVNERTEDLFGYGRGELLGLPVEILVPERFQDEAGPGAGLATPPGGGALELFARRKDGTEFAAEITFSPLESDAGALLTAIVRDVTERKRVDEALRESEQRYRAVVETSNDAFVAIEAGGTIIDWNEAAVATFGWSREEILGMPLAETIIPERYREKHLQGLVHYLQTGEGPVLGKTIELFALDREGLEFPVELTIWPVRTESGLTFSAFARDITERRRVQERLQDRERQLARSNDELRDFASAASHDLREPLRKIRTFGAELQGRVGRELDAEGADYLERILSAAERGHRLVEGLLALSHVTTKAQPHEPVEITTVAHEVVTELDAHIKQLGATVEIGDLPIVEGDRVQMDHLFQNLVENALKFRRPNVPPVVRIFAEASDDAVSASGGLCRITVEDNGIGFDEQYEERIFRPFERLHSRAEYEGSGLGLALCKRIVERHHGRITVSSTPGSGSAFTVTLPISQH